MSPLYASLGLVRLVVHHRGAGSCRFRVESQPGNGQPVCCRRTARAALSGATDSIGCT